MSDYDALIAGSIVVRIWPGDEGKPEGERRLVRLRVPSLADRFAFLAGFEAAGVPGAANDEIAARRRAAIALLPADPEARATFERLLDAAEAAAAAAAQLAVDATPAEREAASLAPQQSADLLRLEGYLRAADPLYAELHRQRELRSHLYYWHAARDRLVGWQNVTDPRGTAVPYTMAGGQVAEAALMRLDQLQLRWVGAQASRLYFPDEVQEKNSVAPSGGSDGAEASTPTGPTSSAPSTSTATPA